MKRKNQLPDWASLQDGAIPDGAILDRPTGLPPKNRNYLRRFACLR